MNTPNAQPASHDAFRHIIAWANIYLTRACNLWCIWDIHAEHRRGSGCDSGIVFWVQFYISGVAGQITGIRRQLRTLVQGLYIVMAPRNHLAEVAFIGALLREA
jgi:hypothetical protein